MATPNLLSLTTITPANSNVNLTTTGATSLVTNAAASGQVCIIKAIYISNTDTATAYNISVNMYSAAALGGTAYSLCTSTPVPPASTFQIIDKNGYLYLLENTSLGATAGTGNKFIVTVSYEVCS